MYRINIELIEKLNFNLLTDKTLKKSNCILINTSYGLIDENKLESLNEIHMRKKFFCKSEKDLIKELNNEFHEYNRLLTTKEIKSMTINNRNFKNIENYMNSNNKFSKKMTDERKKKVIYGTKARLFFEDKMDKNNISKMFLVNKWFMGPIYSYDNNYTKLI